MNQNRIFPELGQFFVGCNYWASHAGTAMWSDWRPEVVEKDLRMLSQEGLQVLRVFPLWPDFQPIDLLYGGGGQAKEYRFGEEALPDTDAGKAGVSAVAMGRFEEFAALAEKHGLKLIVGLLTGWMSGRLFVPPALKGKDILTDKTAIQWQIRFVKYFVKAMKDCKTILAWDLGNECNCMQGVESREDAWVWTASIADAIKSIDSSRPLVSGMHSLTPAGKWTMQDQGELTDILTTHPYPFWTPYCDYDPINTIRPILHATAESLFYSDIGRKPCFAEEIGNMGPMVANESHSADFARASLMSLWAHGCHGFAWWCANDQTELEHAPYDWFACEGELGLITTKGRVKPVLKEMSRMKKVIDSMPFEHLPPRIREAVCILNTHQDHLAVALSTFMLSKQAGFDLEFQFENQPLKDAPLYMVPCISGVLGLPKYRWKELMKKVEAGASLYVSNDDGYILQFEEATGLVVKTRARRSEGTRLTIPGAADNLVMNGSFILQLEAARAEVLGTEADGNPAFTCCGYGKGKVYFLSLPMEMNVIRRPGALYHTDEEPYWKIYAMISQEVRKNRVLEKSTPLLGVTEHCLNTESRVAVMVNYKPAAMPASLRLEKEWQLDKVLYGTEPQIAGNEITCTMAANEAMVLLLKKL